MWLVPVANSRRRVAGFWPPKERRAASVDPEGRVAALRVRMNMPHRRGSVHTVYEGVWGCIRVYCRLAVACRCVVQRDADDVDSSAWERGGSLSLRIFVFCFLFLSLSLSQ